ncbi:MAG: bifunctional phosphopantothenoylcysteine decarboxylase/phosphopantothenate--cysteine ligase CoaBC [Gammaproteobacteria bacterium]|nr:bifunctional phosphopantothenoylcysteine decarboxylase/phosphopantothenate--cysteine ligase CoaBC [Gammaproteobacteria bacterium]NNL99938.1 bifunctional phosphopantothenoylcysteine decarboxylase/phosphopantothenate--cysteine ligase CoaBC [Gammaproteobacteria bacterium]
MSDTALASLRGRRILVGITGGIAAYKSAELVRALVKAGAECRVVMTEAATAFIGPLTLQALSTHPVHTELLDPETESAMGHIDLARWADAVVVAPASADFLARLAAGHADDLLATLCLATTAPIMLAPAMNQQMWQAASTADNLRALGERGLTTIGPAAGSQACGEFGPGRMEEPDQIAAAVARHFASGALAGVRVLITAGPTREAIDAVRFISNRSSGRMGYAIARAALDAGASVTLISGPTSIEVPERAQCTAVESAQQMYEAVMEAVPRHDVFIATAAVADYRAETVKDHKIKKNAAAMSLTLVPTPDILAAVGSLENPPFTVGFAAETDDLEANARRKLENKSLDLIAANWVGRPGTGFDADENELLVLWRDGAEQLPRASKDQIARRLTGMIAAHYQR